MSGRDLTPPGLRTEALQYRRMCRHAYPAAGAVRRFGYGISKMGAKRIGDSDVSHDAGFEKCTLARDRSIDYLIRNHQGSRRKFLA